MKLYAHILTYHNSPIQVREQVVISAEQRKAILKKMHTIDEVTEAVILETCNRLEFYLYAKKIFDTANFLNDILEKTSPGSGLIWNKHSSQLQGPEVVEHLFEVAAGLDSQMIGENQILAQVKSAYTESLDCRMSRLIFHRLFHNAFRAGKAVRTHTSINCGAVSIGLAAVELAKTNSDITKSSALIIGAGENAELVARYLLKAGVKELLIANREINKARQLCDQFKKGSAIPLDAITDSLNSVDIIIATTAANKPIVTYNNVQSKLKAGKKKLLIIDIAVPRDIDPKIGQLPAVSLYNIDDLDEQIQANQIKRQSEIPKAKEIVQEFAQKFMQWYDSLDLIPVITNLTQKGNEIAHDEVKRYAKDFGPENKEKLNEFAESLVKKLLHGPISYIKESDEELNLEKLQAVDLINKMFLQDKGN
jgi:glutamyl-tRNA reductase